MPQYTTALDTTVRQPDGSCTIRVRDQRGEYVQFVVRDGETIRTDDPVVRAFLDSLTSGPSKVVNVLATRPPAPTHDVDTKPRQPRAPVDEKAEGSRTR